MAKTVAKRKTAAERRALLESQRKYDYDMGVWDGLKQAQTKQDGDQKLKLVEANIRLAQQLGQMIEATARAVITFIGEGGLR